MWVEVVFRPHITDWDGRRAELERSIENQDTLRMRLDGLEGEHRAWVARGSPVIRDDRRSYTYWINGRSRPRVGDRVRVPVLDGSDEKEAFVTRVVRRARDLSYGGPHDEVIEIVERAPRPTNLEARLFGGVGRGRSFLFPNLESVPNPADLVSREVTMRLHDSVMHHRVTSVESVDGRVTRLVFDDGDVRELHAGDQLELEVSNEVDHETVHSWQSFYPVRQLVTQRRVRLRVNSEPWLDVMAGATVRAPSGAGEVLRSVTS